MSKESVCHICKDDTDISYKPIFQCINCKKYVCFYCSSEVGLCETLCDKCDSKNNLSDNVKERIKEGNENWERQNGFRSLEI